MSSETNCVPGCDHFLMRTMNLNAKYWPTGTTFLVECVYELGHKGPHRTAAGCWTKPIKSRR